MRTADRLKLAAIASIAVAVLVLGLKYLAYWVTGSVALYSDALEGIVNLITALVALYAIHVSAQPADRRHQFRRTRHVPISVGDVSVTEISR